MSIQEEKQLVLRDLCARVPHSQFVDIDGEIKKLIAISNTFIHFSDLTDDDLDGIFDLDCCVVKPYLRPMSSMTEEEKKTYESFIIGISSDETGAWELTDWLNKNHFDYRGLIERDLAKPLEEINNKSEQKKSNQ